MEHVRLLEKVLEDNGEHDYWCLAKSNTVNRYGRSERVDDDIVFVSFPREITKYRGKKVRDLSYGEVENLGGVEIITNLFITSNYPPFQHGQSLRAFYDGFAVTDKANIFLEKARELKSTKLYEFEKLLTGEVAPTNTKEK